MSAFLCKITFLIVVCCGSQSLSYVLSNTARWQNKEAEIYFLLDSSASVWIVDYRKQLKFVSDLVGDMDIGSTATRVGVGVFSEQHYQYIALNNNKAKDSLRGAIEETPYLKGNTYISRALKGMREQGFSPSIIRQGVPLIAVLLTDGMSRHKQLTADNATLAKKEGIFIFTIGIGHGTDKDELRAIASDPKADFTFNVPDYDSLEGIREELSRKMSEVEFLQADKGTCGDNTYVDTVFVYDEASLGDEDSKKVKMFMQSVVDFFSMNSGHARVGVVSKTCHEGDIMLGQYVTKDDFKAGLNNDNGPEIISLMKKALLESFLQDNGARYNAKRRIVLLLHAATPAEKQRELLIQAYRAKHMGIEMFIIRMGTDYNKAFINSLASDPSKVIFKDSPNDLTSKSAKDEFRDIFCQDL